jgi:hypothetical protein
MPQDAEKMNFPLTPEWADIFGREWVSAWNSHDLDRICSHYAADIEFSSPFVRSIAGAENGVILALPALRNYFASALQRFPALSFEYMFTCCGIRTVTVVYRAVEARIAAETMELCAEGKVVRASAQYMSNRRSV